MIILHRVAENSNSWPLPSLFRVEHQQWCMLNGNRDTISINATTRQNFNQVKNLHASSSILKMKRISETIISLISSLCLSGLYREKMRRENETNRYKVKMLRESKRKWHDMEKKNSVCGKWDRVWKSGLIVIVVFLKSLPYAAVKCVTARWL